MPHHHSQGCMKGRSIELHKPTISPNTYQSFTIIIIAQTGDPPLLYKLRHTITTIPVMKTATPHMHTCMQSPYPQSHIVVRAAVHATKHCNYDFHQYKQHTLMAEQHLAALYTHSHVLHHVHHAKISNFQEHIYCLISTSNKSKIHF